jgi:hypothetical protein
MSAKWHAITPHHRKLKKRSYGSDPEIIAEMDGCECDMRLVECQGNVVVEATDLDAMGEKVWRRATESEVADWLVVALFGEDDE